MSDLFRDTAAGNLIRLLSRNKCLQYPEEVPDFKVPYPVPDDTASGSTDKPTSTTQLPTKSSNEEENLQGRDVAVGTITSSAIIKVDGDLERLAHESALQPTTSQVILPVKTKPGIILVDWYSTGWVYIAISPRLWSLTRRTDDPANPRNWSTKKKTLVCTEIW